MCVFCSSGSLGFTIELDGVVGCVDVEYLLFVFDLVKKTSVFDIKIDA